MKALLIVLCLTLITLMTGCSLVAKSHQFTPTGKWSGSGTAGGKVEKAHSTEMDYPAQAQVEWRWKYRPTAREYAFAIVLVPSGGSPRDYLIDTSRKRASLVDVSKKASRSGSQMVFVSHSKCTMHVVVKARNVVWNASVEAGPLPSE